MKKGKDFFAIALYITFTRRIRERGEKVLDKSHYVIKIASRNFSVFVFFFFFSGISGAVHYGFFSLGYLML